MSRKLSFTAVLAATFVAIPGAFLLTGREPAHRLHEDITKDRTFVLNSSTSPRAAVANDLGALPATSPISRMTIHFRLSTSQQADLDALLQRQTNRLSSDYHKWLSPEQFASRFGVSDSDLQKVRQWLESNGLTITETARSKTWIGFTGIAGNVQNAFGTSLHRYSYEGVEHFANAEALTLPAALNGLVSSVRGLNDFHPRPHIASRPKPRFTSNITGNHFIAPDDFATIYDLKPLYNAGINGAGQKIAVVGQTDLDLSDVRTFRIASGLPANDPQVILAGTDPGTSASDQSEANLDLEWAGAVAPQATILYVNSSDAFNSATYAIDNNLASVLSLSYGDCEASFSSSELNTLAATFQQGNAEGITIVAASGDTGAADCDGPPTATSNTPSSATHGLAVDVPSSLPSVTGMGGTTLQDTTGTATYWATTNNSSSGSALSYIPEAAWNDTAYEGVLAASGGGKSAFFAKPTWQAGLNVPNDGGRDTPDLAFAASPDHDGYLVCSGGTCVNGFRDTDTTLNVVGGASVAAPTFAGVVALLNQQTNIRQGNINPGLYSLASTSTTAFHDITQGNNIVPCVTGSPNCTNGTLGFSTGPGYDQVTGLGSVDAYNLISQWGADFNVTITPTTLTVNPGQSGTATVQVAKVSNFAGTVSFTCTVDAVLTKTTCSIPGTVIGSGTATLTVSNSSSGQIGPRFFPHFKGPTGTGVAAFGAFALALGILATYSPKRQPKVFFGTATLGLLLTLTACDTGNSGSNTTTVTQTQTPASVTGNVTVTATSGVESHSATVSVTVP